MKCTFLGTGTSMGVPVAGGFGRERLGNDPRNQRTRCSVWLQTDQSSVLIDVGPEFRIQSIRSNIRHIDLVLITHEHMDHIAGLDDLRSFNYVQKAPIPLLSSQRAIDSIRTRFDYMFGEKKYPGSTSLDMDVIEETQTFQDLTITPLPYKHGNIEVLGFRINNFSYMTDVKEVPDSTKEKIKGSKVLVLSGLRWDPEHPTHLTIPEAVEIANEIGAPKTYLIHMNSYVDHAESNKKLPKNIRLAYDQLEIEIR